MLVAALVSHSLPTCVPMIPMKTVHNHCYTLLAAAAVESSRAVVRARTRMQSSFQLQRDYRFLRGYAVELDE